MSNDSFVHRLNGRFDGMIRLADIKTLSLTIAANDGWYLVNPDHDLPEKTVNGDAASAHLQDLVDEILKEERGVWTTMVYVESKDDPSIIKIFHPRRAGCGCGPSQGVRPWWVISRVVPENVPHWKVEACTPKRRLWH